MQVIIMMRLKAFGLAPSSSCPFERIKAVTMTTAILLFPTLELNAHEGHPAAAPFYAVTGNESHQHHKSQQSDGYRKQEYREHLEPFIGDVVYQYYNDGTYHQENAVLRNPVPVVATLVGQRTGSTEYLCDGDEAKEKENNPNHFVAFEYAL